jgi:predicted methyltransferase
MSLYIRSNRSRASVLASGLLLAVSFCNAADAATSPEDPIAAAIASERMPGDSVEDAWRKPDDVLRFLEVAPGQHVLDFYSGPGYYTELLSRIVGPSGRVIVYNNELYNQAANHELLRRLGRKRLPNTQRINAPSNYIPLQPATLDRVLFVLVYHDLYWQPRDAPEPLGDAQKVLGLLHSALKPGGLVVVVDHFAHDTPREDVVRVASRLHRIDPKIVRADFEQAGFEFVGESDALRHSADDYSASVFNPKFRRRTDQFIYKFRKR